MREEFFHFLESPELESFLKVRSLLLASPAYAPYSNELDEAEGCLEEERLEDAKQIIFGAMPNLLMSPRAHLLLSYIFKQAGDDEQAQIEGYTAAACCEGILSTGDGTKESPYLVLRTTDEHDLLQYLQKEFKMQALVSDGERSLDHLGMDDGGELWFDITDAIRHRAN